VKTARDGFPRKKRCSFGFCQNEVGEGFAQIFCHLFISAFLVNKRSLFPPNLEFRRRKEVVKVVQIRGRGGGDGNLDKIQNDSSFFLGKPSSRVNACIRNVEMRRQRD